VEIIRTRINVLHLEDNKNDAELIKTMLTSGHIVFTIFLVDNREDFLKILKEKNIDLIIADYSLPSFDGLTALNLVRELKMNIPFIFVSGVLKEEKAIEALHHGATDYIIKSKLERLVPSVNRVIQEINEREQSKKMQEEITQQEVMFQKIAERVRGFLRMNLPSGNFTLVDKYFAELSGYSMNEWHQTPNFLQKIIHHDFLDYYNENFKKMQQGFVPKVMEYKIIRKDDKERWWIQFNLGAYDIDQKLLSISMVIIDNTEIKESQLKYQHIFENAIVGIFRTDVKTGEIIEANDTMAQIFGYTSIDEFKKYSAITLYRNEEQRKPFLKNIQNEGYVLGYKMQAKKKNGEQIWISLSGRLYPREGYIEGFLIDISEQKKAEDMLERDRRAYQIISEAALQAKDISDLCNQVLVGLIETLSFDFGIVHLYSEKKKLLNAIRTYGIAKKDITQIVKIALDDPDCLTAEVARTKKAIFSPDISKSKTFLQKKISLHLPGIHGFVSWPILNAEGNLLGTIQISSKKAKKLTEEDKAFLEILVKFFAIALERKFGEKALQVSEEEYRKLFHATPIGIITCDKNGIIQSVNKIALHILGSPSEEATKEINLLTFPLLVKFGISKDLKTCLKTGDLIQNERVYSTKWGKEIILLYKIFPLKNQRGKITGAMSTFEDISERKQNEKLLQESERSYRLLAESITDVIFTLNLDWEITYANPAIEDLIGFNNKEILVKSLAELLKPQSLELALKTLAEELEIEEIEGSNPIRSRIIDLEFNCKDGSTVLVEAKVTFQRDNDNKPIGILGVLRDISKRKEMKNKD